MRRTALLFLVVLCLMGVCSCSVNNSGVESKETDIETSKNNSLEESVLINDTSWDTTEDVEDPSRGLATELKHENGVNYYTVTGIGSCADTEIVIPGTIEGVPVIEIAVDAFNGNTRIQSLYCGSRVTKIGDRAFLNCKNLKTIIIPDNVLSIGKEAFESCGVTDLVLGDRIKEIGRDAFMFCAHLKSIKLPNDLTAISDNCFCACTSLFDVELSPNIISIGDQAFSSTRITSIYIPASVSSISPYAFDSTSLVNFEVDNYNPYFSGIDGVLFSKDKTELIRLPDGRKGDYAVPEGVRIIGENAISDVEVTLSESVSHISTMSFRGKAGITINANKGLSYIDQYAFVSANGIVTINYPGTKEEWNSISKANEWHHPYFGIGTQSVIVNCIDGSLTFSYSG